jgi:hypothetical protein
VKGAGVKFANNPHKAYKVQKYKTLLFGFSIQQRFCL